MNVNRIATDAPFDFPWPDRVEPYEKRHRYAVMRGPDGGSGGEMSVAVGWRTAFGRDRRRILVFRNTITVLAEFVGEDDWEKTRHAVWRIKVAGTRKDAKELREVPPGLDGLEIGPASRWLTGPRTFSGLVVRLHEDDHAAMIRVAIVREGQKPLPKSERPPTDLSEPPRRAWSAPAPDQVSNVVADLLAFGETVDPLDLFPTLVPEAANLALSDPFAFALATCLDRGTKADIIWTIPYWLKERLGHLDPKRLAAMDDAAITDVLRSLPNRLRYMDAAPRTIREISRLVANDLGGDASRIWCGRTAAEVRDRFLGIYGVGDGIANMAVLLLEKGYGLRFDDLDRPHMDIKPDVHTVRVLHRLGLASSTSTADAIAAARRAHPAFPGALDAPLWQLGRTWCSARAPRCGECAMARSCAKVGVGAP